jgi:hypothetical protein
MLKRCIHPPHEHVSQSQTYKYTFVVIKITDVYHQEHHTCGTVLRYIVNYIREVTLEFGSWCELCSEIHKETF